MFQSSIEPVPDFRMRRWPRCSSEPRSRARGREPSCKSLKTPYPKRINLINCFFTIVSLQRLTDSEEPAGFNECKNEYKSDVINRLPSEFLPGTRDAIEREWQNPGPESGRETLSHFL